MPEPYILLYSSVDVKAGLEPAFTKNHLKFNMPLHDGDPLLSLSLKILCKPMPGKQ